VSEAQQPIEIRPMSHGDLPGAVTASSAAFGLDVSDKVARGQWQERVAHALYTDPDGAFVALRAGRIVGVAEAIVRERLWILSLLAVKPGRQSGGAGRALMDAALGYGTVSDPGLISSSVDPRAMRLYGLAGFGLRPTFQARGTFDGRSRPSGLPIPQDGTDDLEALEPISREVRGAPHTLELPHAIGRGARVFVIADRGFVVARRGHGVWLLAARDPEAAVALLWHALEFVGEGERSLVRWITGEQDWAIDVLLRAGLELSGDGPLCVRGRPGSLRPYIPSPPFA
jgi:ribosomal protein S18 acetylase RimI-like enzyme